MKTIMKQDHPLTQKGVQQAQQLNRAWKAKLVSSSSQVER
jgi:hypothetical protein